MHNAFLTHEADFATWSAEGFDGVTDATREFLEHLDERPGERCLWPHQLEAFHRLVYSYEVLGRPNLLLNIVTGGGKTAIIAATMAWLRFAHNVRSFVVLTPNLIVRDRLREDLEQARLIAEFSFFPSTSSYLADELGLHVLGEGSPAGMLENGVILGNIHQLYSGRRGTNENLAFILNYLGDLAIFNDEAHNTPAPEYTTALRLLARNAVFRLDTTATPDRADGQQPDSTMIYEYGIGDALRDGVIKTPVVYQPDVEKIELTYRNPDTGDVVEVEDIDWDDVDARGLKPHQFVTDRRPMRQQLQIGLARLAEQELRANGRYKPLLFVVAISIRDAKQVGEVLEKEMGIATLVVTEESEEAARQEALVIGDRASPYRAVVSVLMLREGWDVPEVGVIVLLRKFASRVYGQQVIGRGLRRIIRERDEREILCVVDHPKLLHGWLWDIFGAKVKENVGVQQQFDLEEDLPEPPVPDPDINDPENLIDTGDLVDEEEIPDIDALLADIQEQAPIEDWVTFLNSVAYDTAFVEITGQSLRGVRAKNLDAMGFVELGPAPDDDPALVEVLAEAPPPPSDELLREQLRNELLEVAQAALIEAGYSRADTELVYPAVLWHVTKKLLGGDRFSGTSRDALGNALRRMLEVRDVFQTPGLVAAIRLDPDAYERDG